MEYRVLGQLEVRHDGEVLDLGPFKRKALLALLLIHRNEVLSTDRIIEEIWGDDPGADRKNALHVHVSNLRKVLEPDRSGRGEGDILLTRAPGYMFRTGPEEVDADRFESAVAEGRALIATDPASASIVLGEGLGLWRGHALEEFTYESFAQTEVNRLNELRLEAVELRVDADLARGLSRELIGELESLVREHSLRERLAGQLMVALYRSGRQAEALRVYQQLKGRLGEELGIEPSRELQTLEEKIVLGDPSLTAVESALLPGDGPEPGLAVRGYELRERIGSGGFGVAYRAFQPAVGREVAVKVIRPELADDPRFIRVFDDESQLVARLQHPNIVPLYDYWREPGAGYLVMKLMQGGSLESALESGPLENHHVGEIMSQIGDALDAAHRSGVIHGDIKPANILIDADGNGYLSDFGIAVGDDREDNPARIPTLEPPYAPPEMREGNGISSTTDIYSLAVVAAQALAGRKGEVSELIVGMDSAVAEVLAQATSSNPTQRFAEVSDFIDALLEVLGAEPKRAEPAGRDVENPYKGLRAFQQADAADFFGRERIVERLVARLGRSGAQGRFVAVVGPSGSGKSSLVKAGLLPALRRGGAPGSAGWYQIEMTPGQHPFSQLEDSLLGVAINPPASLLDELSADGGIRRAVERVLPDRQSQLVVVIDQFEELYTLTDPATTNRFLDAILAAVTDDKSRIRVVATLRADFYDRPLSHRSFGEILRHCTELVTPLSAEEMQHAITGPARRVGVEFEPALVAEMINDVAERPGALPLLQYALTELFDQRRGPTITPAVYQAIGGVAGALGDRAESLYNSLEPDIRAATRQIFLRLVSLGEGSEDTRRRVLLTELTSLAGVSRHVDTIIQTYGRHRLLSFDRDPVSRGPTVEISHEALLREWPRFQRWIEDGRSDVRAQRRLATASEEWLERDEEPGYVLTGARLARYDGWMESSPVELTEAEQRFLEASWAAQHLEEEKEQEHALQQERFRRRNRLLIGLAVVTAVVIGLGSFAFVERQRAEDLADELVRTERARHLTGLSLLQAQADPEFATMLAVEAARSTAEEGFVVPEAIDALHASIQSIPAQYPVGAGAAVAVRGINGVTGVFVMPPDDLISFAQAQIGREFTAEECSRLFRIGQCPDPRGPLPTALTINGDYGEAAGPQPLSGTTVVITGPEFGGIEVQGLEAAFSAITDRTGIEVIYQPGNLVLETGEGFDGDIAIVPQPANVSALASEGLLMDVSRYVSRNTLTNAFGDYLVGLTTVGPDGSWPADEGQVYGIWTKIENKSLIWHPIPEFTQRGYRVPGTWEELIQLSDRMVSDGETPWCLGVASGPASGWLATDWVESIVLRTNGAEFYDRWVGHEIPFDHPAILDAVGRVAELAFTDGYVQFGPSAVADRFHWEGAQQIAVDPPQCWLYPQASFAPALATALVAGETGDVIDFPTFDPRLSSTTVVAGTFAVALADRPEVRVVMEELVSPAVWSERVRLGGFFSPHRDFDLGNYPSETERRIAELTLEAIEAGGARFDGSDLMPPEVGQGTFWEGMLRLFREGPDAAAEILAEIEQGWVALEMAAEG